ncbi:hypothetical protein [cf. Phormidesmis sp. LEGE 11477]|uniref:hypothetical protein n=1 Tax=cf. Phormidesmis sp. LEGE 11477 TaxID=1828680 RepID=UPI001882A254|nr:hypothetical protein [cf. Phormidesmis sp. LEGE 11477]MBE9064257.1 hypothetical protein [cf. Phormidesmis sp. LEGE 11477]
MTKQTIAQLIEQEVRQPSPGVDNADNNHSIAQTQNTPLAELQLTSQGLFDESKALWQEFVAFDQEHQLTQRVGAQLWRLTKAVGKPALILSLKGIQTAVVTVSNAENRESLTEHFTCFASNKKSDAALGETVD